MRYRLVALVGFAVPALALAAPAGKETPAARPPGEQAAPPSRQAPDQPNQPPDARTQGTTPAPDAAQPGAPPAAQQPPTPEERAQAEQQILEQFEGKKNFELSGTAVMVDPAQGSLVIQRQEMPIAFLIVPQSVPVQLNGKKARLSDIQPGAEVRATFNLAQQYPIALSIDATQEAAKAGAAGKTGERGKAPAGQSPMPAKPRPSTP